MKDLYYILGADAKSTPVEIGEAYRSLAKKLGPQAIDEDPFLQRHFREINDAYEILSDPRKRNLYDEAFKKAQRRQLAGFKIGHLNFAATGVLLMFTGLFGYYVVRLVSANKPSNVARQVAAMPVQQVKHHKHRHHHFKYAKIAAVKPIAAKPAMLKKDSIFGAAIKNPSLLKPAVIIKPQVLVASAAPVVIDSGYTTNLKSNLAGLVYLHQTDDYMSPVVTVLPHRSKIKVLEKGANFYKVAFNEQTGYIPKWTVAKP